MLTKNAINFTMTSIVKTIKIITIIIYISVIFSLAKTTVYAADCLDASPGGNLVLTTSCSFTGAVNGVDSGSDSNNTATITLESGSILTILPGQTIAVGSVIFKGGSLNPRGGTLMTKTPLWMIDEDADGYPATTIQYAQLTPPLGARRRNTQTSMVNIDKNDTYYCPDSYNPNVTCNECLNGQLSYQPEGVDNFSQCSEFNLCDGIGKCSLHAKRVFISSTGYDGNLRGLTGADQICQTLADSVNLNGIWKAWLSDSITSVSDRFAHSDYPYVLIDEKTKIADNWLRLTSAPLAAIINITETKTIVSKANVWTNTNIDGSRAYTRPGLICGDWNKNVKIRTGIYGKNNLYTSAQWTNFDSISCNKERKLYCFEQ